MIEIRSTLVQEQPSKRLSKLKYPQATHPAQQKGIDVVRVDCGGLCFTLEEGLHRSRAVFLDQHGSSFGTDFARARAQKQHALG